MRIDDLRETLQEHGSLPYDEGLADRADAVRGRVRTVRRRRAGAVAAAVVLAVVAVPTLTAVQGLDDRRPDPAGRDLAGRTAPETLVANGFTYDFSTGVEGSTSEPLEVRLEASDEPRLVSWTVNATQTDDADSDADPEPVAGRLVERGQGTVLPDAWTGGATGFDGWDLVLPGAATSYRLTPEVADGQVDGGEMAIAVYTLGDEEPPGVSGQGVTFRDRVGDRELLGAAIGEPGEATVSIEVPLPDGPLGLAELCTAPTDHAVHVRVEGGRGWIGGSCAGEPRRDAGSEGGGYELDLVGTRRSDGSVYRPGDTVTVTASIHPDLGGRSEPVGVDGAFVAVAAYTAGETWDLGAGQTVPEVVERDGHVWRLSEVGRAPRGQGSATLLAGGDPTRTTLVDTGLATDSAGDPVFWSTTVDGRSLGRSGAGRDGSFGPGETVRPAPGEQVEVVQQARDGVPPDARFWVATYVLADGRVG